MSHLLRVLDSAEAMLHEMCLRMSFEEPRNVSRDLEVEEGRLSAYPAGSTSKALRIKTVRRWTKTLDAYLLVTHSQWLNSLLRNVESRSCHTNARMV